MTGAAHTALNPTDTDRRARLGRSLTRVERGTIDTKWTDSRHNITRGCSKRYQVLAAPFHLLLPSFTVVFYGSYSICVILVVLCLKQ